MADPQTQFGQSDALALELVDGLNAASAAGRFCLRLTASRVFARKMELASLPKIGDPVDVQLFPGHDGADREGISGIYDDTYGVHIVIQQVVVDTPNGGISESQCALLMQLRTQMLDFLMSKRVDTTRAVHNFTNAHVLACRHGKEGVYDLLKLEAFNTFYSETILTYKVAGLRR
jgi:hypothetical protein